MGRPIRYRCDCGGPLSAPLPQQCPHCGRALVVVRHSGWAWVQPGLVIVGFFALLIGGLALLLRWFS